jgi:hypothetical protein
VGFGSWRFKSSHPHSQINPDPCLVSAQTMSSDEFPESHKEFFGRLSREFGAERSIEILWELRERDAAGTKADGK